MPARRSDLRWCGVLLLMAVDPAQAEATHQAVPGLVGEQATPPKTTSLRVVNLILRSNCTACHNQVDAQGGLDLSREVVHANLVNKPAIGSRAGSRAILVVPGKPEESYFIAKLLGTQAEMGGAGTIMPLGSRLDDEDIAVIRRWIEEGAQP